MYLLVCLSLSCKWQRYHKHSLIYLDMPLIAVCSSLTYFKVRIKNLLASLTQILASVHASRRDTLNAFSTELYTLLGETPWMPFQQNFHWQYGKALLSSSDLDVPCLSHSAPHKKDSDLWLKILVHLRSIVFLMADWLKHWCNLVSCDDLNAV